MLNPTDARVFALLANGMQWTARYTAACIERSPVVALRSLRRLTDAGLVIEQVGVRRGFGTGSAPSVYTRVPGAVFPGVTPWGQRDTRRRPAPVLAPQVVYVAPQPVTAAPTLAGTVAQTMRGKD